MALRPQPDLDAVARQARRSRVEGEGPERDDCHRPYKCPIAATLFRPDPPNRQKRPQIVAGQARRRPGGPPGPWRTGLEFTSMASSRGRVRAWMCLAFPAWLAGALLSAQSPSAAAPAASRPRDRRLPCQPHRRRSRPRRAVLPRSPGPGPRAVASAAVRSPGMRTPDTCTSTACRRPACASSARACPASGAAWSWWRSTTWPEARCAAACRTPAPSR